MLSRFIHISVTSVSSSFLLICSVAQSCLTLYDPMTTAHQLPCPSPSPWAYSNSCPWSQWCHPTISSSVVPFSSCLQSFPASGSFPVSWLFTSGGQSIGTSASVPPVNIQGWFPLGLTGLISLQSKGLLRVFSSTAVQNFFTASATWKAPFLFMAQKYSTVWMTLHFIHRSSVGRLLMVSAFSLLGATLLWTLMYQSLCRCLFHSPRYMPMRLGKFAGSC